MKRMCHKKCRRYAGIAFALLLPLPGGGLAWQIGRTALFCRTETAAFPWLFFAALLLLLLLFSAGLLVERKIIGDSYSRNGLLWWLPGMILYGGIFSLLYFTLSLSVAGIGWLLFFSGSAVFAISFGLLRGIFGLIHSFLSRFGKEEPHEDRSSHQ